MRCVAEKIKRENDKMKINKKVAVVGGITGAIAGGIGGATNFPMVERVAIACVVGVIVGILMRLFWK